MDPPQIFTMFGIIITYSPHPSPQLESNPRPKSTSFSMYCHLRTYDIAHRHSIIASEKEVKEEEGREDP